MVRARRFLLIVALLGAGGLSAIWLLGSRGIEAPGSIPEVAVPLEVPRTSEVSEADAITRGEGRTNAELPATVTPLERARSELRGRVTTKDGSPLAGSQVSLRRHELTGFDLRDPELDELGLLLAEGVTDATGEFGFLLMAGECVDVHASFANLCPAVESGRCAGDFVELELMNGFLVHGRITRARDGSPVEDATVRVFPASRHFGALARETTSGADGTYSLRISFSDARLGVTPRSEQSSLLVPVSFGEDATCTLDVVVQEGLLIEGRVSDRLTGRPIVGARVHEGVEVRRSVVTDARGEYRLPGFGNPDVAELHADARGYGRRRGELSTPVEGRMRVDFELLPGHGARGRVVEWDGQPIEGAYVAAVAYSDANEDWCTARTDSQGNFGLEGLAPELRHALMIAKPAHATQVYDFPALEATTTSTDFGVIALLPARSIRGRAVDENGAGVPGVVVGLRGWNADRFVLSAGASPAGANWVETRDIWSDAEGHFEFSDLAPGEYAIHARATGRPPTAERNLRLVEGEDLDGIELLMPTGAGLRGRVVDEHGQPLPAIHVALLVEALHDPATTLESYASSTRTDATGAFEFSSLPPGEYGLELFPTVLDERDLREPPLLTTVHHVLADSAPLVVEMTRGRTIEGTLMDEHGAPLSGYRVQARGTANEIGWTAFTDSTGAFAMPLPRDTKWNLEVLAPEHDVPLLIVPEVASGSTDVLIELPN